MPSSSVTSPRMEVTPTWSRWPLTMAVGSSISLRRVPGWSKWIRAPGRPRSWPLPSSAWSNTNSCVLSALTFLGHPCDLLITREVPDCLLSVKHEEFYWDTLNLILRLQSRAFCYWRDACRFVVAQVWMSDLELLSSRMDSLFLWNLKKKFVTYYLSYCFYYSLWILSLLNTSLSSVEVKWTFMNTLRVLFGLMQHKEQLSKQLIHFTDVTSRWRFPQLRNDRHLLRILSNKRIIHLLLQECFGLQHECSTQLRVVQKGHQ